MKVSKIQDMVNAVL